MVLELHKRMYEVSHMVRLPLDKKQLKFRQRQRLCSSGRQAQAMGYTGCSARAEFFANSEVFT
jgi:hypothetical protein